jgi:hypothetical protein
MPQDRHAESPNSREQDVFVRVIQGLVKKEVLYAQDQEGSKALSRDGGAGTRLPRAAICPQYCPRRDQESHRHSTRLADSGFYDLG